LVILSVENLVDRWRIRIVDKVRDIDLAAFQHIGRERVASWLTRETTDPCRCGVSLCTPETTRV